MSNTEDNNNDNKKRTALMERQLRQFSFERNAKRKYLASA